MKINDMRNITQIIIPLLCLLQISCSTEEYQPTLGNIEGIVINSVTKEAIYGCEVISNTQGTQHTDANGLFRFSDIPAGALTLEYRCDGYETARQTVNVQVGKTVSANISLNPLVSESGIQATTNVLDFGTLSNVLSLTLKNLSSGALSYTIEAEANWISADPSQGTIPGKGQSVVKISVNRDELSEGHYEKSIKIVSSENEYVVQVLLEKGNLSRPTVITGDISQDMQAQATVIANGAVTVIGSSGITRHGFEYSTDSDMSEDNIKSTNLGNLNSPADFQGLITNLEYDITYYIRAYATNGVGTAYGETKQIKLLYHESLIIETAGADNITANAIVLNGTVASGQPEDLTECGFYYGTTSDCSTKKAAESFSDGKKNFSLKVTDLSPSTLYYYRAYGITNGVEILGLLKSVSTLDDESTAGELKITTTDATDVQSHSAVLNGLLDNMGKMKYKEYGFYYGKNPDPTIRIVVKQHNTSSNENVGVFSSKIENLEENQTYYFKAYVIDENNKVISGEVLTFETSITPSVILTFGEITKRKIGTNDAYTLTLDANLYPQGLSVIEAGFITNHTYYDYDIDGGYDFKLPCEIEDNTIKFNKEYTEYNDYRNLQSGTYVRAYMIFSDGTVIYSQNQGSNHGVYIGPSTPYIYEP